MLVSISRLQNSSRLTNERNINKMKQNNQFPGLEINPPIHTYISVILTLSSFGPVWIESKYRVPVQSLKKKKKTERKKEIKVTQRISIEKSTAT